MVYPNLWGHSPWLILLYLLLRICLKGGCTLYLCSDRDKPHCFLDGCQRYSKRELRLSSTWYCDCSCKLQKGSHNLQRCHESCYEVIHHSFFRKIILVIFVYSFSLRITYGRKSHSFDKWSRFAILSGIHYRNQRLH